VDHAEVATWIAEVLNGLGHVVLDQPAGSVSAQVRVVGEHSSLVTVSVCDQDFVVLVGYRRPPRCPTPVIFKFPNPA
jgi:hypothetical protein